METGFIGAPRLRVAAPEREMDGATNLFVKQGVFGILGDAVVSPECEFTEPLSAWVHPDLESFRGQNN